MCREGYKCDTYCSDHNGAIPASYLIPSPRYLAVLVLSSNIWHNGKYYAEYLGIGMRYEAGICTIVIGMKRTFK